MPGYFLGVTSDGALYQLGWPWMDDLQARLLVLLFGFTRPAECTTPRSYRTADVKAHLAAFVVLK